MGFFFSLTAICLFTSFNFVTVLSESSSLALNVTEQKMISNIPTHIVKFKASAIGNNTGKL